MLQPLIALALVLLPTPASAQDGAAELEAEARARFALGELYYSQARFAEAATEFEAAYSAHPHPTLLHNIYLARRDLGDLPGAVEALGRYLEAASDLTGAERRLLEGRLAAMQRQIGTGIAEPEPDPEPVTEPTPDTPTPTDEVDVSEVLDAPVADEPAGPDGALLAGGAIGLSVAGASALAMGITGPLALVERGNLGSTCSPFCSDAQLESARALGTATDVLLGIGITGAVAGIALLVAANVTGSERIAAAPVVTADQVGVVAGGSF